MQHAALLAAVLTGVLGGVACSRIANGQPAAVGAFPGQVSLQYNGTHSCGASVIDAFWVLTTAQCVYGKNAALMVLVAGTNDLHSGGTSHRATKVITHEQYIADDSWINDIALIKVDAPFDVSGPEIRRVQLPSEDHVTDVGSPATVVGWGRTAYNGNDSFVLRQVELVIQEQESCVSAYSTQVLDVHISNICAGTTAQGGGGFCDHDAGAPLYVAGVVVGLASFNIECGAVVSFPDVFTRVAFYRQWITEQTGV